MAANIAMAEFEYLLMCLLSSGDAWCESSREKTFQDFLWNTFKWGTQDDPQLFPVGDQDSEFCCSYPDENGSNCLVKGLSLIHI